MSVRTPETGGRVPAQGPAGGPDQEVLRDWLEHRLPGILGVPSTIDRIDRQRCKYASSYDAAIVTVHAATGAELKIFLKDFGCSGFPKNEPARRRDRERRAYEILLQRAGLGTPQCYGSVWDESCGRFWLFLEFVNGPELRAADFEYWIMAAGWLGQLHGRFARQVDSLRACDFLVNHDSDFFRAPAELALRDVAQISAPLARRLATLLNGYDPLVRVMARQPPTLVHGHYRPCNILVDVTAVPARVCPVDWEQTAVGSGFYDLAFIADGFERVRLDRLVDAYRQQALAHHLAVPDAEEIRYIVDCFRLFMRINLLSRACERGLSEQKVARTIDLVESLFQLVASAHGGN
jgi:hypothetical protein